jgi:hypothetical protein
MKSNPDGDSDGDSDGNSDGNSDSDKNSEPLFIGWADTPPADRRFFLRAGIGLTAASAALGFGLAALQQTPGSGRWNPDAVREWRGIATAEPYAMLRTNDLGGGPRTALLSCLGKCGVAARIGSLAGQPVVVKGSLIQRGQQAMISVDEEGDWIRRDDAALTDPKLAWPVAQLVGDITLSGEILDSKCWFGAMRPSEGKVHKACAALCIRGGIPPAFFARGPGQQGALMIMTTGGRAHGRDLLGLVADPVRISGRVLRLGDLLLLDAAPSQIVRM